MLRRNPSFSFIAVFLLIFLILPGPVSADGNPADSFVRFLKIKDYAQAYGLLSPALKFQFSQEKFEEEQREAEKKFTEQFGTPEIFRAEELVLKEVEKQKSVVEQMQLGDVDLGKFMFWNWWKSGGPKRYFYQFVFGEKGKIVFGVDIKDGAVVNYEFLPRLQAALSSKNPDIAVKKTRVIA